MKARFSLRDQQGLEKKLKKLSEIRWEAVVYKSMAEIYNRGKSTGTPVDTGALMLSLAQPDLNTVAYGESYAPHVEYGHRTVNGGYVKGQRYLRDNVKEQRPIFVKDLREQLRRA